MRTGQSSRVLLIGTLLSMAVVLVASSALLATETSRGDTSTAFGLVFMVSFYLISIPLHGMLTLGTILLSTSVGFRPLRWIYAYLLLAAVIHLAISARIGAFDELERSLAEWQRSREQPTQVALERAVARSDVAAVRAALDAGANPDGMAPGVPLTPILTAALMGDAALANVLLEGGADPNLRAVVNSGFGGVAINNFYPLDAAAFSESPERLATVQHLLAFGADARLGHARLGACAHGDLALYEVIISAGAPDAPDNKGNSCLHFAAMHDQPEIVARAIRDGADPTVVNIANQRPFEVAINRRNFQAALAIAQGGGFANDESHLKRVLNTESSDPAHSALREWILENSPHTPLPKH